MTSLIDDITEKISSTNEFLNYGIRLSPSLLAKLCERASAFSFRWAGIVKEKSIKAKAIFQQGNDIEAFIVNLFKSTGYSIKTQVIVENKQYHFFGYIDILLEFEDKVYVVEIKSMNEANFNILKRDGIKSKPDHYQQIQSYMHFGKYENALYFAMNKNTSEFYMEEIPYDPDFCKNLEQKMISVLSGQVSFPYSPLYICKLNGGCEYFNICHGTDLPSVNCRTCFYLNPVDDAKWFCTKLNTYRTTEQQKSGNDCEHYYLRAF